MESRLIIYCAWLHTYRDAGSNNDYHNVYSGTGSTGGTGGSSKIYVGGTLYEVTGGAHGHGGAYQYANSSLGWNESFIGAEKATATTDASSDVNSNYGNTTYGNTEERGATTGGNTRYTNGNAIANASQINNTNWDNSIAAPYIYGNGGLGGDGGWGYSTGINVGGANAGLTGEPGTQGQVTIIWLY